MTLTGVHGEDFLIAKQSSDEFLIFSKQVAVECSRCQAENAGLVLKCLDNAWMTVALVDGTVSAQKVIVAISLHVPYKHACNSTQSQTCTLLLYNSKV